MCKGLQPRVWHPVRLKPWLQANMILTTVTGVNVEFPMKGDYTGVLYTGVNLLAYTGVPPPPYLPLLPPGNLCLLYEDLSGVQNLYSYLLGGTACACYQKCFKDPRCSFRKYCEASLSRKHCKSRETVAELMGDPCPAPPSPAPPSPAPPAIPAGESR